MDPLTPAGASRPPRDLDLLPKAELHLHLEGAVRWATAREFVRAAGLPDLPESPFFAAPDYRFPDFESFLGGFRAYMIPTFTRPERYRRVARELAEDLARQQVRYAEVNFAPGLARLAGLTVAAAAGALHEGFAAVPRAPALALVAGFSRDKGPDHALEVGREALEVPAIMAIDLHGAEESAWPPSRFRALFDLARDRGRLLKAHAGEFGGPESIADALSVGVARLGHALALPHDPSLADETRRRQVVLEMCPTSNLRLRRIDRIADHPLPALLAAGHRVTVNSDDPLLFDTTLTAELERLRNDLQLSDADLAALQRHAFSAALATPDERHRWLAELDGWIA